MKLQVEHVFQVSRDVLWQVLHDQTRMADWIPGCDKLEEIEPDRFAATMKIGVGAIKGTYKGTVQIGEKQEPSQYTLAVEGSAAPGFVRGKALMKLHVEDNNVTRLVIDADAQVGGLIASVGQRFVSGIAKQLTRELLANIEQSLQPKPEATA